MKRPLASKITETMATWRFVFITLFVCAFELWWNSATLIPDSWKFDKTMLTLNTGLSLWAAIQGSVIMIDARYADKKRDAIMKKIEQLEKRILKDIEKRD